jgi:hypothetical protein
LLSKFEKTTKLNHATFYSCLSFAKTNRWIVADHGVLTLNSDGCWRELKPRPIGVVVGPELERHQLEHNLDLEMARAEKLEKVNARLTTSRKAVVAGKAAGRAVETLVAIMQDVGVGTRRRIQAADALLQYKAPEDVTEHAKVFLTSVFTNDAESIDCRLEATTLLRRFESPRIAPAVERPPYRGPDDGLTEEQRRQQLATLAPALAP